jgi:ribonuclease P protein component
MVRASAADRRFPSQFRIRLKKEFAAIFSHKRSAADRLLLVFGCENGLDYPRLGLSVPRNVGNAVVRNRWKRIVREAFRLNRDRLPQGIDLVVVPRPGATADLSQVAGSLLRLGHRLARGLAKHE